MIGDLDMFWKITLSASLFIVVGFAVFARWCGFSPAVRVKDLDALRVGMSADEVTALLGSPREKRPGENRTEYWVYGKRWKRHVLVAEFAADRRLKNFVHGIPSARRSQHLTDD